MATRIMIEESIDETIGLWSLAVMIITTIVPISIALFFTLAKNDPKIQQRKDDGFRWL